MKDSIITPKKDIILLTGRPQLRIDMVAGILLVYFEKYEYVSRTEINRNKLCTDEIIDTCLREDRKVIINGMSESNPDYLFKVLFANSHQDSTIANCDYVIDLDQGLDDEEIVKRIIVAWGCWLDGRPITKPM